MTIEQKAGLKGSSMDHDLIIRGGTIVDGSGTTPYVGDVAISGDTITHIGEIGGKATEEIDALGHIVTPRIRRSTHPPRCANWLGPNDDSGELARCNNRFTRKLRCDLCTLQTRGQKISR